MQVYALVTISYTTLSNATRGRGLARCIGPLMKASNCNGICPKTRVPFKKVRVDPSASTGCCSTTTNCGCGRASVLNFDLARLDKANVPSLKSFLFVPKAKRVGLRPKDHRGPSRNCHSQCARSRRRTAPGCCTIHLRSCNIGTRVATKMQDNVFHFACPRSRGSFVVVSVGRAL